MIIESIVIGITTIFSGSLIFAYSLLKRQREWDLEDGKPDPEPEPEPIIYPFFKAEIGTLCPK